MYRLLAIDLDGTLLNPQHVVTPRTREMIRKAVEAGLKLVMATGNRLNVLQAACADLPLSGPQIVYNGAIIADIQSGAIVHQQLVPEGSILPALAALHDLGLYRGYHTYEQVYVDENTPNARNWYRPPVPPVIEVEDVASLYPQPCLKLAAVGAPKTLREKRTQLEQLFARQLYVTQTSLDLLELLHPAVSKDNALKTIVAMSGIQPEEVVAFGDNHNDIGMLRFAGLGIAMGHAHNEVKAAADYVTLSNAEDGVAAALADVILPRLAKS